MRNLLAFALLAIALSIIMKIMIMCLQFLCHSLHIGTFMGTLGFSVTIYSQTVFVQCKKAKEATLVLMVRLDTLDCSLLVLFSVPAFIVATLVFYTLVFLFFYL